MKKLIILAAFFIAPVAMACPNLTGSYTCVEDGQPSRLVISQSEAAGVTTFRFDSEASTSFDIIADGQVRDASAWMDGLEQATYTATCVGAEQLVMKPSGIIMENGQPVGKLDWVLVGGLDAAGNITQNVTGTITGDFGTFPIDEQNVSCARN
jgi:hypothetical protein